MKAPLTSSPMGTRPFDCDVAVIGGGPAGSSAAIDLGRRGRSVVLFERDGFPRFHIGESLLATANEFLDRLGVTAEMRTRDFPEKWGATFTVADGSIERYADFAVSNEIENPQTWQVRRADFDALLYERTRAVGVDRRDRTRVLDVDIDVDGVTIRWTKEPEDGSEVAAPGAESAVQTTRARAVVDATGRWGLLARKFTLREDEPRLANIAFYAHYEGVPRAAGRRSGDIWIIGREDMGWFWVIPVSSTMTSVGVVLRRSVYDTWPREGSEAALARAIAETPAAARLLANATRVWPVRAERDFSYQARQYAGDRWLLAGDAGSFLDPVFSTGVAVALESGLEAAAAMDGALAANDLSAARFARFDRRQRQRYLSFRRFVLAFYTQEFRDLFFQPGAWPAMFGAVVTQLAGRWRPRRLQNRLLIALFFALVRVQRVFELRPRLDAASRKKHGNPPVPESGGSAA